MEQKKQTILDWYRENHEYIDAPCGGRENCGRCKIKFLSDAPTASDADKKLLSPEELADGVRLACMTEKTDRFDFCLVGDYFAELTQTVMQEKTRQTTSYGIALDVGTTTLVMRLVDLETGKGIATSNAGNHQRVYGADVLSRIKAANEGHLADLQYYIQNDIFKMLTKLISITEVRAEQIKKIVIAANTTMCHLLLGYSCEGLGRAPFTPVDISLNKISAKKLFEAIETKKEETELINRLNAEVVILPGISTFVGADIVAGMFYCDMDLKEEAHMLLDVGTNGEMVIGNKNEFVVTSAAAGPVFEGGKIKRGSELIDIAASLLEQQVIDENGTLCEKYFESGYNVQRKGMNKPITISQTDIRELQEGKAAIRTGIEVLLQKAIPQKIYIAGGFGVAINVNAAVQIGLFPKEYKNAIVPKGNTALEGAHKFLIDVKGEERVQNIVRKSKEILLAKELNFEEKYIHFMQFLI